jgi:MYXO-CTERM domain-containing protein
MSKIRPLQDLGLEAGGVVDDASLGANDAGSTPSTGSGCACGVAPTRASDAWTALVALGAILPLRRKRGGRARR